jgi:hypothetical protein
VFVVGGHDKSVEARMQEYQRLFETGFEGFRGRIIAGGTDAGLSRLVGSLNTASAGGLRPLTYLPRSMPTWTIPHPGYEVITTEGDGFTPLESIRAWSDLMAAGVNPTDVKILGINGGQISAFEYRMALVLGATVGVVRDSGRAANEILADEFWCDVPNLLVLPADPQTVKVFVQGIPASRILTPDDREDLARRAHDEYLKSQKRPRLTKDPSQSNWDELPDSLKASNRSQIDHLEEKLRAVHLRIRRVEPGERARIANFTDDQYRERVELMAEMEHGRWNAERVFGGWTLGEKDVEAKRSPYLLPWCELPPQVQEWDRDAIRAIPGMLAALGYEIIPE